MSTARLNRQAQGSENSPAKSRADITPASSSDPLKIPYIDPALLTHLRGVFAPKVSAEYSIRDYDRQVGHSEIIEHIARLAGQP